MPCTTFGANFLAGANDNEVVPIEQEARFWLQDFSASCLVDNKQSGKIVQHYIPLRSDGYARVRNQYNADVLTVKRGWGLVREEPSINLPKNELGKWLVDNLPVQTLVKQRYQFDDGWTLDLYLDPEADGLVILEYEGPNPQDAHKLLPSWVKRARDVTKRVDNAIIARWIWEKRNGLSQWTAVERMMPVARIALDGGPGCGKTTLVNEIRERERSSGRLVIVPEAARLLSEYGLVAIPIGNSAGMASFEGDLFRTHEILYRQAEEHARRIGARVILEDRHPVHPLCYLDNNQPLFELATGTTVAREMAKGDLIIYLELPPREIYDEMKVGDPTRYEDYAGAVARDKVYQKVYQGFGDRLVKVPFEQDFDRKRAKALDLIEEFLATRAA